MVPTATPAAEGTRFREQEAALVAELLRVSRLTILFGDRGAGKTTLLKRAVLPLLGRRLDDRYARPRFDGVVVPFPERRRMRDRPAEIAMYFDSLSDSPLFELQTRIASALIMRRLRVTPPFPPLAESLARWSTDLGVRFLFIFDHFETLAGAQRDKPGARAFEDALVELVNSPSLSANVLISVRDEYADALAGYRARIPGFGDATVRLPHYARPAGPEAAAPPPIVLHLRHDVDDSPQAMPVAPPTVTPAFASPRDWPAAADATAHETALEALREWDASVQGAHATTEEALDVLREWRPEQSVLQTAETRDQTADATAADAASDAIPAQADPPEAGASPASWTAGRQRNNRLRARHLVLVVSALVLALATARLVDVVDDDAQEPRAPANASPDVAVAQAPPVPPTVDPRPQLAVAVDAGSSTDAAIVNDLSRIALPGAPFAIVPAVGIATPTTSTPVAITSFDVLRPPSGARRPAGSEADGFAIVTPLYTEEVHAIVRRDSSMRALHDMRGARINVGPAGSGSRVTALRLYARMFEASPVAVSELAHEEALSKLLNERSVDVVIVVAAQPVRWLAELPRETASSIRLLHGDPDHGATTRAIEDYLPARIRANLYPWLERDVATVASMAFMVVDARADARVRGEIGTLATAICERFPELRSRGHPKWSEVQPGLRIEGGWHLWPPAQTAFDACAARAAAGPSTVQRTLSRQGAAR